MAKQADGGICVITRRSRSKTDKVNLVAHHRYYKQHSRHLADSIGSIITLCTDVHEQFYGWNGGYARPCTPDDLIRFVQQLHPQRSGPLTMISDSAKKQLGDQSPSG